MKRKSILKWLIGCTIIAIICTCIGVGTSLIIQKVIDKDDSNPPEVKALEDITIPLNSNFDEINLMEHISYKSKTPIWYYEIGKSNLDTSKPGKYNVTIEVHDTNDDKADVDLVVNVSNDKVEKES